MAWDVAFCMAWGLSFVWGHLIIWDLHGAGAPGGLWRLSSFDAGGVVNSTSNLLFTAPSAHEVGWHWGLLGALVCEFFWWLRGFLGWSSGSSVMWGAVFHVAVLVSYIHLVIELLDFLTNS